MPTIARPKPVRLRKVRRKAIRLRAVKKPRFVLSEAEIVRINGAKESLSAGS
jgi:hypothetical protein